MCDRKLIHAAYTASGLLSNNISAIYVCVWHEGTYDSLSNLCTFLNEYMRGFLIISLFRLSSYKRELFIIQMRVIVWKFTRKCSAVCNLHTLVRCSHCFTCYGPMFEVQNWNQNKLTATVDLYYIFALIYREKLH